MLEWILPDELIELILHPNESVSGLGVFLHHYTDHCDNRSRYRILPKGEVEHEQVY